MYFKCVVGCLTFNEQRGGRYNEISLHRHFYVKCSVCVCFRARTCVCVRFYVRACECVNNQDSNLPYLRLK